MIPCTCQLIIQHENLILEPVVEDGIDWTTERKGVPGELHFTVAADAAFTATEGDPVRLMVNGTPTFYGFIFTLKRDRDQRVKITAYDQLRYLKNKDTYVYTGKRADQFIQMVADDFKLQVGELENTGYVIPSRVESNTSLFDMIQTALDLTLDNTKELYVMYDDFGKITLKSLGNMRVGLLVDEDTAENFDYSSSIDNNSYDQVKLTYDNQESAKRDVYLVKDSAHINKWGVLQYYDTLKEGENGAAKAEALLSLYNKVTRTLTIKDAFGDLRVRAGSLIFVNLVLGDYTLNNFMLVERCKHTFKHNHHSMNLTLRGGEFTGG